MVYVSSSCIKKNSIVEVIQRLVDNGFRNIELSGGTDYYDGIQMDLINMRKKYQLQYTCHAYFPPPIDPFVVNLASCNDQIYQKSIEHYDNCIELLKEIECNILSVHSGFMIEIKKDEIGGKLNKIIVYDKREAYSRFCYAYERLSKKCKEYNIMLYLENNVLSYENYENFGYANYFMMTDYESIMYMNKQIDFNLLLDLGHLYVSTKTLGLDYKEECQRLKKYVRWIHISENNGICDEHNSLTGCSRILEEYRNIYAPGINVTLEAVTDMDGILQSMNLLETL